MAFGKIEAASNPRIAHGTVAGGTFSLYVNGSSAQTNSFPNSRGWSAIKDMNVPIRILDHATVRLRHEGGDGAWDIDVLELGTVAP